MMAHTINDWPTERKVERADHDWDSLLDGQIWVLTEGADFQAKVESVRSAAYHAARKLGVKVRCMIIRNNLYLQKTG